MPRSGRPINVPAEVAKEAAALVKEGEWVSVVRHGTELRKKVYYTSIFHVVSRVERLQEIMDQYDVDVRGLLHAMHKHDPDLMQRSIYFKYEFPPELLQARVMTTAELLRNLPPPGSLERRMWLDRLVWIDEGGVMLSDYAKKSVKVWCSKHDFNRDDVVHLPHLKDQDECKVHFILAVTSHPAFIGKNGLVYWEFTTGTTNIRRRRNTLGQDHREAHGYQTKAGEDAQSTVQEEIADNLYLIIQEFRRQTGEEPILVMDNIRIQAQIPDDLIESRYGDVDLPAGCRIRIPAHSPDLNQVAEHSVAAVKMETRAQLYRESVITGVLSPVGLQRIVEEVFKKFEKGEIFSAGVERNVLKMPFVWEVISGDEGTVVHHPESGEPYTCTGGNWAPGGLR